MMPGEIRSSCIDHRAASTRVLCTHDRYSWYYTRYFVPVYNCTYSRTQRRVYLIRGYLVMMHETSRYLFAGTFDGRIIPERASSARFAICNVNFVGASPTRGRTIVSAGIDDCARGGIEKKKNEKKKRIRSMSSYVRLSRSTGRGRTRAAIEYSKFGVSYNVL